MSKKIYIGSTEIAGGDGKSAYQSWLDQGNVGTEAQFVASLKGADGKDGKDGAQGNTGSSVDYPYELVNNVTTNDATKGLSAAQGKVLDDKISQLGLNLDGAETLSIVPNSGWNIGWTYTGNAVGGFIANASRSIYFVNHLVPGTKFRLTATGTPRYSVGQFNEDELTVNTVAVRQVTSGWQSATSYEVTLAATTHSVMILLESGTESTVNAAITGLTYAQVTKGPFLRESDIDKYTPLGNISSLRNGMIGNTANTKAVTTPVMPTCGYTKIGLTINRPNTPGYRYRVSYALTSDNADIGKMEPSQNWSGLIIKQDFQQGEFNPVDIAEYSNAVGIAFDIWEVLVTAPTSSADANTLRVTNFADYKIEINYISTPSVPGTYSYIGEPLKVSRFGINTLVSLPSLGWYQSMVFYNDIGLFFNERTMKASLVNMEGKTILATLDIPYGSYTAPHCNTASLGKAKNGSNSIFPLVYVSQWTAGAERACFVYDVTLSGSTYALTLVQQINLSGVSGSLIGEGPCDFVVDTDNSRLIAFAYKTAQATNAGTKLMICQFALPDISTSEVVLTDGDVLAHLEVDNIPVRQDAFYDGGKINIISGNGSTYPGKITSVRIADGYFSTIIPLGNATSGEPEGFDIYKNQVVFSKGGAGIFRLLI